MASNSYVYDTQTGQYYDPNTAGVSTYDYQANGGTQTYQGSYGNTSYDYSNTAREAEQRRTRNNGNSGGGSSGSLGNTVSGYIDSLLLIAEGLGLTERETGYEQSKKRARKTYRLLTAFAAEYQKALKQSVANLDNQYQQLMEQREKVKERTLKTIGTDAQKEVSGIKAAYDTAKSSVTNDTVKRGFSPTVKSSLTAGTDREKEDAKGRAEDRKIMRELGHSNQQEDLIQNYMNRQLQRYPTGTGLADLSGTFRRSAQGLEALSGAFDDAPGWAKVVAGVIGLYDASAS